MDTIYQVGEFHAAFGVPMPDALGLPPPERAGLRVALLREEVSELAEAFERGDLVAVADALADIQVVLDGTYLECGMRLPLKAALVDEVMRANMSKLGDDGKPLLREDGKILKGPGYTPPDVAGVLAKMDAAMPAPAPPPSATEIRPTDDGDATMTDDKARAITARVIGLMLGAADLLDQLSKAGFVVEASYRAHDVTTLGDARPVFAFSPRVSVLKIINGTERRQSIWEPAGSAFVIG